MIAIYVRQSLDKKDSLSIEAQIEDCVTICKRNGWNTYKVYKDKGWSAKNLERPSFQQLNQDVKAGLVETVVCYKIDRISRNIRDLVNLIEDYNELGVHFISFADNINTAAPGGMMMATLFGSLAQMEREAIITRVTDNYYYRCELGYWGGGPAPYGYRLKKIQENNQKHTVLEIDEKEAPVVRQFFTWYLEPGATIFTILNRAQELGIKTRKGSAWTSRVMADLLSKPLYAPNTMDIYHYYKAQGVNVRIMPEQCDGSLSLNVFGKRERGSSTPKRSRPVSEMTLAIAKHVAIIDGDTFLRVQGKRKSSLQVTPRSGTSRSTILSGLVRCGMCGRAMSPSGSRLGTKYFICSGKKNYAHGTCPSKSIKVSLLESIVLDDLLAHLSDPKCIDLFHSDAPSRVPAADATKINALQQEHAQIENEIRQLIAACASANEVAIEYLNDHITQLDARKKEIGQTILSIRQNAESLLQRQADITAESVPSILRSGSFDDRKLLCRYLIREITYAARDHITIIYNL
ncbi:MAG: recombinase family protein [Lachnospiraceae bacterium]|nr:recombinase family protein [Lachnospiraceae bacterium]